MKTVFKVFLAAALVCGLTAGAYPSAWNYWKRRSQPVWQTSEVTRGDLVFVVNSTGTVKPVLSVRVGAVVSGPVTQLCKDFNDEVQQGDLLAVIDPQLYQAAFAREDANVKTRAAERRRVEAQLNQAKNDYERAQKLYRKNPDFISHAELDQLHFGLESLEAQLDVAKAAYEQAQASLDNAKTNLEYTRITSPVDGVIIDRKIDAGQSLVSSFQTPELFVVAPDLRKRMHVYATVDENDIGLIRQAQQQGQTVHFRVSAYPDDWFSGEIEEIRLSSSEVQNVVTYPVIVAAANPDLKLLPGMTAEISFHVAERHGVTKVPNAALRYYPEEKYVRSEDRGLLKGQRWENTDQDQPEVILSVDEKIELRRKQNRRHVWIAEGDMLRAVEVVVGLADGRYSELLSGGLKEGDQLVTGIQPKK